MRGEQEGARKLKKRGIIIISVILAVLLIEAAAFMAFCAYMDRKTEGRAGIDVTSLDTLKDCFLYAEEYKDERFGDKYELHSVTYEFKRDAVDEVTFIYTKRKGWFKNVYFVTVDRTEGRITVKGQAEANRLYGRDLHLNFEEWSFDFETLDGMSRDFEYDEIQWHSVYENAVVIVFKNGGSTVYAVDIDPFSLRTINAADNS